MNAAHEYPGYKNPCNGCGECCLYLPCPVAHQMGLWQGGKCTALEFKGTRYVCNVILNPGKVSLKLKKFPYPVRAEAIGINRYCDALKEPTP